MATAKGLAVAKSLGRFAASHRLAACTFVESGVEKSHDSEIRTAVHAVGIPILDWEEWQSNPVKLIRDAQAELVLCIGWKYLLPKEVCEAVNGNVIIAHDSLLPKLRGFAPLPTAMMTGESHTGVSFLQATPSVDAGPIYWQREVPILQNDLISDLISRVIPLYVEGCRLAIADEFPPPVRQDESEATYSIWRNADDYFVDWSGSAMEIERMVRALGSPYLGARTRFGGETVVIDRATVVDDLQFAIRQPGKIWSLDDRGRPTIICGIGLLRIDAAQFDDGASLIPMKKLRRRFK